jgi:hypothetical protein
LILRAHTGREAACATCRQAHQRKKTAMLRHLGDRFLSAVST